MQKILAAVVCAGLLATTLPTHALSLVSRTANGHRAAVTVNEGAMPTIAVDIGFNDLGSVSWEFELSAADVDGLAAFNAVVDNLSVGGAIAGLELTLDRGTFALVGAVTPAFAGVASVLGDDRRQYIALEPAEAVGVDLGNPFAATGQDDWLFGFAGMQTGERFTLTVSAVPEPGGWAVALAGIGVLATVVRRRRVNNV